MAIIRLLIISTRETPEMAASPTLDTIITSDKPTVTAKTCSTKSGIIRAFKADLLKISLFSIFIPL